MQSGKVSSLMFAVGPPRRHSNTSLRRRSGNAGRIGNVWGYLLWERLKLSCCHHRMLFGALVGGLLGGLGTILTASFACGFAS
eukprot:6328534-Pyramimonas_sp.AAC.1